MESSSRKNFALGIVTMSVTGGLQRDCIVVAQKLEKIGHKVTIFCARQEGNVPGELSVRVLPNNHLTNHARNAAFSKDFRAAIEGRFDCVIGFNALDGLDIHYCGDMPILPEFPFFHLLPRFRTLRRLERHCFGAKSETVNLLLSESQALMYQDAWHTPHHRMVQIAPNLEPERRRPQLRRERKEIRQRLGYDCDDWVWLGIATQPHTKGTDRTLRALMKFPNARLILVGSPGNNTSARRCAQLVHEFGLASRVQWLGHREDMAEVMAACDVFVHPARVDTTGKILLEALVNGLPVITTAVCGYSPHVASASAGIVLPERFSQRGYIEALKLAEDPLIRSKWSLNGEKYGAVREELYAGFDLAVEQILKITGAKILRFRERAGVARREN